MVEADIRDLLKKYEYPGDEIPIIKGSALKALEAAGPKTIFTHSIGRNNRKETVLTESEFCKRIQYLKDYGLLEEYDILEEF